MPNLIDVTIDVDEAYPVYFMHPSDDDFWKPTGQIDMETYARWTRVTKEYNQVQTEMAAFQCINGNGGHTFITLEPPREPRTYCTKCYADKGETIWE